MLLAAVAALLGFTASADEWKINGDFKQVNSAKFPSLWIQNKPMFKQASAVMVPGKKAGENAVKITSKGGSPTIYSGKLIPVKQGDKIEVEFEAKGKGKARIGVYLYGDKGHCGSPGATIMVNSPDKFTEYKAVFTLGKTAKPYKNARATFGLWDAGEVTFADLEYEIKK